MNDDPHGDTVSPIPDDIEALAATRADARRERDFGRADELKSRIESAGWKVIDDGSRYSLIRARPPDRVEDDRLVYGSPASVPSRLDSPARPGATIVLVAGDPAGAVASAAAVAAAPELDVVVVAVDGSVERAAWLERLRAVTGVEPTESSGPSADQHRVEIVWTTSAFGPSAALVAGLRRVGREVVILVEAGTALDSESVTPIRTALEDPTVAAVGIDGLTSDDLHRFTAAGPDEPVVALGSTLVAMRRSDVSRLDAIDGRLGSWAGVMAWSSLALCQGDRGEDVRRVVVLDLPVRARQAPSEVSRRDRYRISARFGEDDALRP